jgi:signal transduction histidine kinase
MIFFIRLTSALANSSFVSSAAKERVLSNEDKEVMKDDLRIIDFSLQFINELLRNMLDMNRAANQQMKITLAPTDILRDVLEPVASILHMRGNKIDILIECPAHVVVLSDRLRLKQIVLNLSANATKVCFRL